MAPQAAAFTGPLMEGNFRKPYLSVPTRWTHLLHRGKPSVGRNTGCTVNSPVTFAVGSAP